MDVLDGLEAIDWANQTHAYGEASDVPGLLRNLLSPSSEVREDALSALYGNIFHQGTRYQATVAAIPFLINLVANEKTPERNQLVYLLTHLALGYAEECLPVGISPEATRKEVAEDLATMSKSDRKECMDFGYGPQVVLDCYEAVGAGVPVFLSLLSEDSEENVELRIAVLYALGWFPDYADLSLPALEEMLHSATEPILVNSLLSIGLLNQHSARPLPAAILRPFLLHSSLLIRTSAAIALAPKELTGELVQILAGALTDSESLERANEVTYFNEGDMAGYCSMILARYGRTYTSVVLPALCQLLPEVAPYPSLGITQSILNLLIYDPALLVDGEPEKFIQDTPAQSLQPETREALCAIADHGGWHVGEGEFLNYSELMRGYCVPNTQEALKKYLSA